MPLRIFKKCLPFLAGLLTGLWFFNINLLSTDGWTHLPGDMADGRFTNYLLEHVHHYISGKTDSFWNAPFLYPEEHVISYSENLMGSAPFYSMFRFLGMDCELAFQWWFLLMSALNYAACYLLLFQLFKNRYAAALGAMIFAFSIALQSQMPHAQTFPRFAIPLALWAGILYFRDLKPAGFFALLFFLVCQFYCGIYLGFMLMVPVALLLIASLVKWKQYAERMRSPRWWLAMLGALAANGILLFLLMQPYMERARELPPYPYEQIVQTVPTLRSFFYSHYGSLFWDCLKDTGVKYEAFWDHQIFAGGLAILCFTGLAVLMLLKWLNKPRFQKLVIKPEVYLLFFTGLVTLLLFIRVRGYSFYQLLYPLPGFASMRALQRIINIELVFFALAVAFMCDLLLRSRQKYQLPLFACLVALIYLDNHIHTDTTDRYVKAESQQRIQTLEDKMKGLRQGTVISYEPDTLSEKMIYYHLDAMMATQELGLKCLNGYTSTSPEVYSYYWLQPDAANRLNWLKWKHISPDSVVVIR